MISRWLFEQFHERDVLEQSLSYCYRCLIIIPETISRWLCQDSSSDYYLCVLSKYMYE